MFQCKFDSLLERKVQLKKPEALDGYFQFQFPCENFRDAVFYDFKELSDELLRMGLKIGFYRGRCFNRKEYQKTTAKKLILTCTQKSCPAKLSYIWQPNTPLKPTQFANIHIHRKSPQPEKLKQQLIQQFIMDLPLPESWQSPKKWMARFDIGERDAKYIVDQLYWCNEGENQILWKMVYEGKCVRRVVDGGGSMVGVFIVTESMRENYRVFGDVVSFDGTEKMVRRISHYGGPYTIAYFMAQDTDLRLVMTAVCIYIKDQPALTKRIFQFFFDLTCEGRPPNVIFTDDTKPINQAIEQLKKQRNYTKLHHFYDWFHVTQNLRGQLEHQPKGPEAFDLFCKALGQCSTQVYQSLLAEIRGIVERQSIVDNFIEKQNKYCICKMLVANHNFGILYSYARSLNTRINRCTIFESFSSRFYSTVLHFQKILQRFLQKVTVINQGIIKHIKYEQIHMLTQKLQNKIMSQLCTYFHNSLSEDLILHKPSPNPLTYSIYSLKAQNNPNPNTPRPRYKLHYSLEHGHWECSCRIQYINGLPCQHIIKLIRELGVGAIQFYVNSRWIHGKQDRIPDFSRPLISRKRRRV